MIYTEITLALVAEGASTAAMQRGPFPWRTTMNVLAMIQAKQKKAAALQSAQKTTLVYRGIPYSK